MPTNFLFGSIQEEKKNSCHFLYESLRENLWIFITITVAAALGYFLGKKSQVNSSASSRSSSEDPINCQEYFREPQNSINCIENFSEVENLNAEFRKLAWSTESISPISNYDSPDWKFGKRTISPFEVCKGSNISPISADDLKIKKNRIINLTPFQNKEVLSTIPEVLPSPPSSIPKKPSNIFQSSDKKRENRLSVTNLPQFNGEFQDLIEILDDGNYAKKFEFVRILGYGGFSLVHLAKHKLDGQLYAIKIVRMKVRSSQNITTHKLFAEVNLLKKLHSKHLVQYITCWAERETELINELDGSSDCSKHLQSFDLSSEISSFLDEKYMRVLLHIQMEYCSGMTLQEYLDNETREIDRKSNHQFFAQILKGVKHIHDRGIIHRDLKPSNIFLDGDHVKIGDFNLATVIEQSDKLSRSYLDLQELSCNIGTPLYLAPEQENSSKYNNKVDIYPIGIVLLELYLKFRTKHERIQVLRRIRIEGAIPLHFQTEYPIESGLVKLMTNLNPDLRPDAGELLNCKLMKK